MWKGTLPKPFHNEEYEIWMCLKRHTDRAYQAVQHCNKIYYSYRRVKVSKCDVNISS